jgi:hypothetical protein
MKRLFVLLTAVAGFFAGQAPAAPQLYTVVGDWQSDASVTLKGDGFGSKNPAPPILWDTLDNLSPYASRGLGHGDVIPTRDTGCSDCPWLEQSSWGEDIVYWDQDHRVPGRPYYRVQRKGHFRSGDFGGGQPDVLYVNWWFRTDADLSLGGSNKFIRVWTDCSVHENGASSWTQMHLTRYVDDDHDGQDDSDSHVHWGSWGGQPNKWHHMQYIVDGSADVAYGYGRIIAMVDHRTVHNVSYMATSPMNCVMVLGFDPSVSSTYANYIFDFGDIYIDNTQARVVVGNASTYGAVTHEEIQIPQAWSDSEVTVTVNRGSFSGEPELWLYVFDANGQYNAQGFPVGGVEDLGTPGEPGQPHR